MVLGNMAVRNFDKGLKPHSKTTAFCHQDDATDSSSSSLVQALFDENYRERFRTTTQKDNSWVIDDDGDDILARDGT